MRLSTVSLSYVVEVIAAVGCLKILLNKALSSGGHPTGIVGIVLALTIALAVRLVNLVA